MSTGTCSQRAQDEPPENLLSEPVGDVAGVPEPVRHDILRAQMLASREAASRDSKITWLLHRLVGTTTSHGRSPGRLVAVAYALAVVQGLLGMLYANRHWFWLRFLGPRTMGFGEAARVWSSGLIDGLALALRDSVGYFLVLLSLQNPSSGLNPALVGASRVFGVVIIGVFVGMAANRLSSRG
jgi:hypothetical protein